MAPRIIRKFFQALGLINRGRLEDKLDSEFARLLESLATHPDEKASGSMTVTITATKLADRLDLRGKIVTKLPPDREIPSATFWPLEGGLSIEHPSQFDMLAPREVRADARAHETA